MPAAPRIVIVGASLGGLMTALALDAQGAAVTLLERSDDTDRTGAALQVGHGLIERLTRRPAAGPPLAGGLQTWAAVHAALQAAATATGRITLHRGTRAVAAGDAGDHAWVEAADGRRFTGDAVVGADGYRSIVRRALAPDRPDAVFAGYLAWVGFAAEETVAAAFPRDLAFLESGPYHLLGFPLAAADGGHRPGTRRIGWAWYDAGRNAALRAAGAVAGDQVCHSLRPGDMPAALYDELAADACRHWPQPWRAAILACLAARTVIGTPVAEYVPDRLVRGRLALVGDAGHVATPMTGNGFPAATSDAIALATAVAGTRDIAAAFSAYESARLADVRLLVQGGQRFSRGFGRA